MLDRPKPSPASHVFPRHTKAKLPTAMRGDGVYLYDAEGNQYLDGSGGAAVSCLGHSDAEVIAAIQAQVGQVAYAHTSYFTSEPAEQLADKLIDHAPTGIERVYFTSGGSEAMEAALKLARQYHLERGEPGRRHFIARRQSYHGNTLGALAVGGNQWRRDPFEPLLIEAHHIASCYAYRDQQPEESEAEYGHRVADELETKLQELGPETVIGFIAEPVVGATLGAVPAVPGYFKRIREICDRHGILMILDEVMCGMGRTGSLFACEQDGVAPDMIAIAKGLGAGYQPIGAALCTGEIYRTIEDGSGLFQHGHTYIGHPTACAAGLAVMAKLTDGGLTKRAATMGAKLRAGLDQAFGQHPHIGDIRGRGMFIGLELVADRETKAAFDPSLGINKAVKRNAFEGGLMCYPAGGTIDGKHGDHVLLAPPFIFEDNHVDELVTKLATAIDKSLP